MYTILKNFAYKTDLSVKRKCIEAVNKLRNSSKYSHLAEAALRRNNLRGSFVLYTLRVVYLYNFDERGYGPVGRRGRQWSCSPEGPRKD